MIKNKTEEAVTSENNYVNLSELKRKRYNKRVPIAKKKIAKLTKKRNLKLTKLENKLSHLKSNNSNEKHIIKVNKKINKAKKKIAKINSQHLTWEEMVDRYYFKLLLVKIFFAIAVAFSIFVIIDGYIEVKDFNPLKPFT